MLTFATPDDRLQAEQLMQPTLIRVIDNLRKHTEATNWQSEYVERVLWPETATEEQQQRVKEIAAQLETASPAEAESLRQQLSHLPTPVPSYELRLTHDGTTSKVDIWQLCFQICFQNYQPGIPVRVDRMLLDDNGEVDWIILDEKAKGQVAKVMQQIDSSS